MKYNLYRYIGCIIDQSNWSRPFSLAVMTPDLESGDLGSRPGQVESFSLQVYFYSYYIWCQDDYHPSLRAKLCLRSQKELGEFLKHLIQMFHFSMEE